jgi:hypothetical protein
MVSTKTGSSLLVEVAFELGAVGLDWNDRACMNVLSLHASLELKQRINCFQSILDDGAQLFPVAFTGVHNLPERHRLAGQICRDRGLYTKRQKSQANDLRTLCFEVLTPRLMDREAQAKRELISLLESAEFGR